MFRTPSYTNACSVTEGDVIEIVFLITIGYSQSMVAIYFIDLRRTRLALRSLLLTLDFVKRTKDDDLSRLYV